MRILKNIENEMLQILPSEGKSHILVYLNCKKAYYDQSIIKKVGKKNNSEDKTKME